MSLREADRLAVMQALTDGQLRQREAATRLGVSVRHVKRLLRRFRESGAAGLISRKRGQPSNRKLPAAVREQALDWVRTRYPDFGPTLAAEMLGEHHELTVSRETLRRWMIDAGLWRAKAVRPVRVHQRRARRPRLGELIQIDGSPHDWFEGRADRCTLILFVDDATSRLMAGRFFPTETTAAYMTVLHEYLTRHGRPLALYSDRHSIFRVNRPGAEHRRTQLGRALDDLGIESICAHSAPAKGRVERANQTLQDRLVKAMRLAGIDGLDPANAFLPDYLEQHNRRFAVEPLDPCNEHLPLTLEADQLRRILAHQTPHRLTRNLTFCQDGREYQLLHVPGRGRRLRNKTVVLCQHLDGATTVLIDGKPHDHRVILDGARAPALADEKTLNARVDQTRKRPRTPRPAADHPWRRAFSPEAAEAGRQR